MMRQDRFTEQAQEVLARSQQLVRGYRQPLSLPEAFPGNEEKGLVFSNGTSDISSKIVLHKVWLLSVEEISGVQIIVA